MILRNGVKSLSVWFALSMPLLIAIDYPTAVKNSYEKLYQSVNPSFNYDEEFSKDSCYRDIPAVNGSIFIERS